MISPAALLSGPALGGIGFVAGAFCPAVLRKLKAGIIALGKKLEGDVKSEVVAVEKKL